MKMSEFLSKYSNESDCRQFFKAMREQKGLECECCKGQEHYWIENESRWKCKGCGKSISLKKGTVMENSNLGYKVWLWGLFLMSLTKKGFSALEMKRLIGHNRYEPIWLMMHKIRISMGHRDDKYKLDDYIEMDEGFFEGHRKRDEDGQPGKELDRQVKAIVAVSTRPIAEEKQRTLRPHTQARYVKMNVVDNLCNREVGCEAEKMIQRSVTVITDGKRCYNTLKDICAVHKAVVIENKKEVSKVLPWVHIAISNAKKKLLGLHHQIKDAYMQNYLNEFCYKFNRRYLGIDLFERVLVATLQNPWYKPFPKCG